MHVRASFLITCLQILWTFLKPTGLSVKKDGKYQSHKMTHIRSPRILCMPRESYIMTGSRVIFWKKTETTKKIVLRFEYVEPPVDLRECWLFKDSSIWAGRRKENEGPNDPRLSLIFYYEDNKIFSLHIFSLPYIHGEWCGEESSRVGKRKTWQKKNEGKTGQIFPKVGKNTNLQIQEIHHIPVRIITKKTNLYLL